MSTQDNARQNTARKNQNWPDYDYARGRYYDERSQERRRRFIELMPRKLICQDCHGTGGERERILDDGSGPWYSCGWCDGMGLVTPWERGQWLRMKKAAKLEDAA